MPDINARIELDIDPDDDYTYYGPLLRGDAAPSAANARIVELEAQLAAVPAYAAYHFEAQLYHDLAEGPEPLDFAGWLAAGKPEGAA